MNSLESVILSFLELPVAKRDRDAMVVLKRAYAKEQKLTDVPSNMQLLQAYHRLVADLKIPKDPTVEKVLRKRSVRSESGIVPIQVLTKPFRCPGKCIFCPNDATMPKSYINTQPGAMRALLNHFDPYKQVYNRLLSLTLTGHPTDKIEMIVLWGTRDVYPQKYKTRFIKGLYDACNSFDAFMGQITVDHSNPRAARYTATDGLQMDYPETIEESLKINETAWCRIIGLTIETRPEYVTDKNCQYRRSLGVTRMEMGIQTLHNDVHDANKRGHDNEAIKLAMHKLRQYGFKVSNHYMPWLYKSTLEKDIETFRIAFSTPWIKSDELKFYPTAVIPNTELYDLYKQGAYEPLTPENLETIIRTVEFEIMPPYARIKRLARDFDTNEVVAWANTPNLRQLLEDRMQKEFAVHEDARKKQYARLYPDLKMLASCEEVVEYCKTPLTIASETYVWLDGTERERDDRMETLVINGSIDLASEREFVCLCTRCREMRHKEEKSHKTMTVFQIVRRYRSSVWEEYFIAFEDEKGYLRGFTRLLLPDETQAIDYPGLWKKTAIIRELHVYGTLQRLQQENTGDEGKAQHRGIGSQLMSLAEQIAQARNYVKLSVISGIWVKKYYEKIGYHEEGTYMVKSLPAT